MAKRKRRREKKTPGVARQCEPRAKTGSKPNKQAQVRGEDPICQAISLAQDTGSGMRLEVERATLSEIGLEPKSLPVETPASLALWGRVAPELHGQPLNCRKCAKPVLPVLEARGKHIAALCPDCGRFLKFVKGAPWPDNEESKRAKFIALVREGRAKGYKAGFAPMAFKAGFGHLPPDLWQTDEWKRVEVGP